MSFMILSLSRSDHPTLIAAARAPQLTETDQARLRYLIATPPVERRSEKWVGRMRRRALVIPGPSSALWSSSWPLSSGSARFKHCQRRLAPARAVHPPLPAPLPPGSSYRRPSRPNAVRNCPFEAPVELRSANGQLRTAF